MPQVRRLTQQEIELINTSRLERGEPLYMESEKRFPRSLYITDTAWEGLKTLANNAGHPQRNGKPNVSEFLEEFIQKLLTSSMK